MGEKTNSKILTPGQLRERRRRDSKSGEVSLPSLEPPKPFPTLADIMRPEPLSPPPFRGPRSALEVAPDAKLPLSRPGSTDQRHQPTSAQYSGLIRRRPRRRRAA